MNLREIYIFKLLKEIDYFEEDLEHNYYSTCYLKSKINNLGGHVIKSKKVEEGKILYYENKAWDNIYNLIYSNNVFSNFTPYSLPFIVTRYISKLEKELNNLIVENYVTNNYITILNNQLKDIELILKNNTIKIQALVRGNIVRKNIEKEKKQKLLDINNFGYPKTEIISEIKKKLNIIVKTIGRENKIKKIRKLMYYLGKPTIKKFIFDNENFEHCIKNKLLEFRNKENIREASVWWRNIFNKRMPYI